MEIDLGYSNKTGFPSVTDIISPSIPNRRFAFKPEYAERGRLVHHMCYLHITDQKMTDDFEKLIVPHIGYFDSLHKLSILDQIIPLKTENRMTDKKLGFTGQADCICMIDDKGGVGVLDWKTSIQRQSWWSLQLAAYAHLCEVSGYKIKWTASVRIRKNGKEPFVDYYDDFEKTFKEEFIPLLRLSKCF